MSIKKEGSRASEALGTNSSSVNNHSMIHDESKDEIVKIASDAVDFVIEELEADGVDRDSMSLRDVAMRTVDETNDRINFIKAGDPSAKRRLNYGGLTPEQAVKIVMELKIIRTVCTQENLYKAKTRGVLAMYEPEGPAEGTYRELGEGRIADIAEELNGAMQKTRWFSDFKSLLSIEAQRDRYRVTECTDPNLVFMQNCIFNYETKERIEFGPEYVTLRKHATYLPEDEPDVPVHMKPDGTLYSADEFIRDLVPYEGGEELLVKLVGAVLRDRYNWRKMVTLYNKTGHNGKSTFLDFLKATVGSNGAMSSSLSLLAGATDGGRFGVSNIVGVSLITCEDSDSGAYIRDNSRLKSIISHDTIGVEMKGENTFDYRPHALIVAAANDLPKTKDKGQAWLDRNIYVPFTGEFRGQADDKLIREKWVVSDEFCSYFAYKALVAYDDYWSLPEPHEAQILKDEFILENDPVVEFWQYVVDETESDCFPNEWLWEQYRVWLADARPNTKLMSKKSFVMRVNEVALDGDEWMKLPKRLLAEWAPVLISNQAYAGKRGSGLIRKFVFDWCESHNTSPNGMGDEYQKWRAEHGLRHVDND